MNNKLLSLLLSIFIFCVCANSTFASEYWSVNNSNPDVYQLTQKVLKNLKSSNVNNIKQAILNKLHSNRYLTARVDVDPINKIISISEEQKYLILFNGNKSLSDFKIRSALDLNELNSTSYSIEDDLKTSIYQVYDHQGYFNTKIKASKNFFKNKKLIRIAFEITEGTLAKLGAINIHGDYSRSEKYYVNFIKNRSSKLIENNGFSDEDLGTGIENLVTDLKNQGYLEASVSGVQILEDKKKPGVMNITFDLYEGKPVKIESINFINNNNIDEDWLNVLLGLKPGEIMDFYKFEKGLKFVLDYYLSTGYLKAEVNPNEESMVDFNQEKRTANINVEIHEGPKVIIGNIEIKGNEQTQDFVILKSINFEVGDVLTIEKLKSTRRRLGLLSLFSKVDIQFENQGIEKGHSVTINVSERKPGLVQFGFGANNQLSFTLKGFAGLLYRNLWGSARAINTRLELQSSILEKQLIQHRAFVSFLEPFIGGSDISGRLTIDSSKNIFAIDDTPGNQQTTLLSSRGFDVVLENQVNKNIKASWTALNLDYIKIFEIDDKFQGVREQIISFGPTIDVDYRNNPVLPTDGFYSRFESEFAPSFLGTRIINNGVSSEISFLKLQGSYTRYDQVNNDLIWVNTLRGGMLRNFSKSTELFPISRAFFLGGTNTIRGFDPSKPNERIPSNLDINSQPTPGGLQGRGVMLIPDNSYYYLVKTEFRFPLYQDIYGSFFYDGGAVLINGLEFLDPYRDSAGLGLRLNTPVGAVSAEVGFKLDRKRSRGESPNQFHISIGTF